MHEFNLYRYSAMTTIVEELKKVSISERIQIVEDL